jgi:predicted alpha-1,2-mannosidase
MGGPNRGGISVWRALDAIALRACAASLYAACLVLLAPAAADAAKGPVGQVDPFIGTEAGAPNFATGGGGGNTFPGPTMPFGMLGWSPDTQPAQRNTPGGYSYDDKRMRGFSLKHASGAGCAIYQDVSLMPTTQPLRGSPVHSGDSDVEDRHVAHFSHDHEAASPGFYRVQLNPEEETMGVALASSLRAGVGRIRFPGGEPASVLINAGASASGNSAAAVQIDPGQREITGSVTSGGFCGHPNVYTLHFVVRFNRGFRSFGTWRRGNLDRRSQQSADSVDPEAVFIGERGKGRKGPTAQAGAFAGFGGGGPTVEVRVGISFVSVENARQNLDAEVGGRSLGAVRNAARGAWSDVLGRIGVSGGKRSDVRRFYTALYHTFTHPSTFSDVNGEYVGMDGEVHTAEGFVKYADFSGWDVYRTQIPLLAMLFPDRASDLVASLLADWRESGWLPRWSVANGHTGVSPGDPADPAIASAYALGATDFDQAAALEAMVQGATQTGTSPNGGYVQRPGLPEYLGLGYVPHELNADLSKESADSGYLRVYGSASTTLEYALADFSIARYAAERCDRQVYATFAQRSGNWRQVLNPSTGYVQPRFSTGDFAPVPPAGVSGFAEGNSAQYTWSVPHDVAGLIEALGGPGAALRRLDDFHAGINAGPRKANAYLGNEPSLGAPWLYPWLGQPYRTQQIVRQAILRLFKDDPGGFPGNDDFGTMSAWYVFGALGFYPAIPGTDVLVVGSPLFRKAVLHLPSGDVTIEAPQAGRKRQYVHALTLNGAPHDVPWLQFRDLAGGRLHFSVDRKPDQAWGSAPEAAPPSFAPSEPLPASCG